MSCLCFKSSRIQAEESHHLSQSTCVKDLEEARRKISELEEALQKVRSAHDQTSTCTSEGLYLDGQSLADQSWSLPDDVRSKLNELLNLSIDPGRSKELENELLVMLGIQVGVCKQEEKLQGQDYERRVAREWEISRKINSLGELDLLRAVAECIPGGNSKYPLAWLEGMRQEDLSAFCQTTIANRLSEVLRRIQACHSQEAGGHPSEGNTKYCLNEQDANWCKGTKQGVYGKIEEFYGGLVDRIGLPQMQLMKGMEDEHCRGEDSSVPFTTSNYTINTTPEEQWKAVTDPETRRFLSDNGRVIRDVQELKNHPTAIKAKLAEAEIIALQLYTGPMYFKYNQVLRAPTEASNKYTTTIHCIVSGLVKLSHHTSLKEGRRVWRGLKGLTLPESFLKEDELGVSGGVEYGLLSTTSDVKTAIQYSGEGGERIVLEMSCGAVDRGASLKFLSQYPGEEEILYPPMSYLEVLKQPQYMGVGGDRVKVLQLKINSNVMSLTIEDFVGKRKQLHVALMENIAREVERDLKEFGPRIQERLKTAVADSFYKSHEKLMKSIIDECWQMVQESRAQKAEWYNDEKRYKEAIENSNIMKEMAMNKIRHWIEDTQGDLKCEALVGEPMKSSYWKTMADLKYKINNLPKEGKQRQEMSQRICQMYGLSVSHEQSEPLTVLAVVRGQSELIPLIKASGCDMNVSLGDGRTGLHVAAMLGMEGSVKELLMAGIEVTAKDKKGKTCAYWACEYGHLEVLKCLEYHCSPEVLSLLVRARTDDGRTCAHAASEGGHLEILEYLKETFGEDVLRESRNDGGTCAHAASQEGRLQVLNYLKETCGDEILRVKKNNGGSCAHSACHGGHLEVLRYLKETCGEDMLKEKRDDGWSCVHWASQGGHTDMLRYLTETCGKDVLREKKGDGGTCAHSASLRGHLEVLKYLKETCGEDMLREKRDAGWTCAHSASQEGHLEVLKYLKETCGEEILRAKRDDGWTCAHSASLKGHLEILQYLKETCGEVVLRESRSDGITCSHWACQAGRLQVVMYLKETCGEDILRQKANNGWTCAHAAGLRGHLEVLKYLKETCGEEILREKKADGGTCVHEASACGHLEVLKYLEETCGEEMLREKKNDGDTCAHAASEEGHLEVLKYLKDSCGEEILKQKRDDGATCAHAASEEGQLEVLKYLKATCGEELLMEKKNDGGTCALVAELKGHLQVIKYLDETCGEDMAGLSKPCEPVQSKTPAISDQNGSPPTE